MDSSFKDRLLADPRGVYAQRLSENQADEALPETLDVRVVEEGPDDLYLVMPTACPNALQGPVALDERSTRRDLEAAILWHAFQDDSFKQDLLQDPKAVYSAQLGETGDGASLPDRIKVHVVEEQENMLYVRIPLEPPQGSELSEDELEQVAGGALAVAIVAASTVVVGVAVCCVVLNDY